MDDSAGVVVVGASAGGLVSLQAVLSRLPANFPAPVLVLQHSDPRRESRLVDILERDSRLDLETVVDGDVLEAGKIYICPSSLRAEFKVDGSVALFPLLGHPPRSITAAFVTAAEAFEDAAVAIILSGTGNDGAAGAVEVKRYGGSVIVESEASATHFGMPKAAIDAGAADFVCAAAEIADVLGRLVRKEASSAETEEDAAVSAILDHVRRERGTKFDQYRSTSIRRRLAKHMSLRGHGSYADLLAALRKDPQEIDRLVETLLINVSGFFRDDEPFSAFERLVVPVLAEKLRQGKNVRVWSAGCATGEEAYSIAMLLSEAVDDAAALERLKVFATDLDAKAVETARKARYSAERVSHIPEERLHRFFVAAPDAYEVKKELRRRVVFGVHDLTKSPPIANLDLITCRNVLIYFDPPLQRRILATFESALADEGFLFLGRSETLVGDSAFETVDHRARLFRKPRGVSRARPRAARVRWNAEDTKPAPAPLSLVSSLAEHVMDHAGLVLIVVGPSDAVAFANREARALCDAPETPDGLPMTLAFPALSDARISDAVSAARQRGKTARLETVECFPKGRRILLDLAIGPVEGEPSHVILVGEDVTARADLQRSLHERGAALQESVEDLQTTNEELQAASEELETANEELQSANEELTTLNEELQSTNEELETTNEELLSTNEELDALTKALDETRAESAWARQIFRAATDASDDAIVVIDPDEKVAHWSRRAREYFGEVEDEVVGRPIFAARLHLLADKLKDGLRQAAAGDAPVEIRNVRITDRDHAERHLDLRIQGLRKPGGEPGGWVVTCRDVTALRDADRIGREAASRFAAILRATGEGVLALDRDGRIVDPSPRAVELLTDGGRPLPEHVWEITRDAGKVFEIKGALADLAKGTDRQAAEHTVRVALHDHAQVALTFVAADVPGLAPIVVVRAVEPASKGQG